MSLGEAFIEVHADLRPFARDLRRNVRPLIQAFEKEINTGLGHKVLDSFSEQDGEKAGDRAGKGFGKGMNKRLGNKNIFVRIASALGSALDDGISALPAEVKAALVLGIAAALPIIGGALTGALVAALGGGIAAVGVLLASQFEEVQKRGIEFGRNVRRELVDSSRAFIPAIFQAMSMVEERIRRLRPLLDSIFGTAATFVEPLTQGALDAVQEVLQAIGANIEEIKPFVDELGAGFKQLGHAIGVALKILIDSGEDGRIALRDLLAVLGGLITAAALVLRMFATLYSWTRKVILVTADLAAAFSPLLGIIAEILRHIDATTNHNMAYANTNTDLIVGIDGVIKATKGETDALKEYRDAIENASDAAKNQLELNISWEESLDNISDALKRNGRTLDIRNDKGRENVRAFLAAIKVAEDAAVQRVRRGEQTAEQAAASYDQEIGRLKQLAHEAGVSDAQFNALFDQIIQVGELHISSTELGVDDLAGALGEAGSEAEQLYATLKMIIGLRRSVVGGAIAGVRGFDDGGILHAPEMIMAAESGPEAIIPLTKPARAAQLLQESGLTTMFGGMNPQFMIFIGNEQLDARTVRIVQRNNKVQATALAHGGRAF